MYEVRIVEKVDILNGKYMLISKELRNWWEMLNCGESPDNWLGFQDDE